MDAPRTVFIELTSRCNMHCDFCPSDILRREKGTLDEARISSFLDQMQALGGRPPVMLNVLGEPLLAKGVYGLLDRLERDGHPVTLITNMTLLGDPQVRRELLRHANLTLAMSLQTATPESYRMRGYPKLTFDDFFGLIFAVMEDKFRLGSGTRLEIHVASGWVLAHDPTIQSDSPLAPWPNFPSERAERRWITRTLRRLEAFGRRMRKAYPESYAAEKARTESIYRDYIGTKIAVSRRQLPPGFQRLKDEVFWGYMPLPHVLLVFKSFELWTRDEAFLRRAIPADKAFYVEENPGPWACPMTESFGLLADGRYLLCCLDYEGEMGLGGIDEVALADVLGGAARARIRADAMTESVCRRCKGNLFVFDTDPLPGPEQPVDKFGLGWWPHEPGLHGRGGRWTKGRAWAYVLARIPARRLEIRCLSPFLENSAVTVRIQPYDRETRRFQEGSGFSLKARKGIPETLRIEHAFEPGCLFRIEMESETAIPAEANGGPDSRRLGLAVHDIRLRI